jgi:hypothetical protein
MQAAMIGKSWSPGCPVPLADLRVVRVSYVGFDSQTHPGTIVGKNDPLKRPYVVNALQYVPGGAYETSGQNNERSPQQIVL